MEKERQLASTNDPSWDWSIPAVSNNSTISPPPPPPLNHRLSILKQQLSRRTTHEGLLKTRPSFSDSGQRSSLAHRTSHIPRGVSKKVKRIITTLELWQQMPNFDRNTDADWLSLMEALEDSVSVLDTAPTALTKHLALLVPIASTNIGCLRSSLAKTAMNLTEKLVTHYGSSTEVDAELQNLVLQLIKRASASSGRETFLVVAADSALTALVEHTNPTKLLTCVLSVMGSLPGSPAARAKLAKCLQQLLIRSHAAQNGGGLSESSTIKCLKAAAVFLTDGASETRKRGKRIVWGLRKAIEETKGPAAFQRILHGLDN